MSQKVRPDGGPSRKSVRRAVDGKASENILRQWINRLPMHQAGWVASKISESTPIQHVVKVYAGGANLTSVPVDLRKLTGMRELNLYNNHLTCLSSDMLRGLTELRKLWLHNNNLSSLPGDLLGGFTGLRILDLSNNSLASIPGEMLRGLTGLRRLLLSNNRLTNLPSEMGYLSHLQHLRINNNRLVSLPDELRNLTSLEILDLRDTFIPSLPEDIRSCLTRLKTGTGIPSSRNTGLFFGKSLFAAYGLSSEDLRILAEGKTKWRRVRVMIVGKGQVGKSSLYNAICEQCVASIESTVVADVDEVEITEVQVEGGGDGKEHQVKIKRCEGINNLKDAIQGELLRRGHLQDFVQSHSSLGRHSTAKPRTSDDMPPESKRILDPKKSPAGHKFSVKKLFQCVCTCMDILHGKHEHVNRVGKTPNLKIDQKLELERENSISIPVLNVLKELLVKVDDSSEPLHASMWDFGGQEVFYSAHVLFIHPKSIYIVVFSLKDWFGPERKHKEEVSFLEFWFKSIQTYAKGARIIVVGTHLDTLRPENLENDLKQCGNEVAALARRILGNKLSGITSICKDAIGSGASRSPLFFFPVNVKGGHDPSRSQVVVNELRVSLKLAMMSQLKTEEPVPVAWARVCDYCSDELKELWMTVSELQKRIKADLNLHLSVDHLRSMLSKFNQLGACVYINEPHLNEYVVLKPKLMIECVKTLIYDKRLHEEQQQKAQWDGVKLQSWKRFSQKGIMEKILLRDLWAMFGDEERHFMMKLLEKHMLIAEIGKTDLVVVPMLQDLVHTTPADTIRIDIPDKEDASLVLMIICEALDELKKWPYSSLPSPDVWLHPLSEPMTASPSTKIKLKEFRNECAKDGNPCFTHFCPIRSKRIRNSLEVFKDWDFAYSILSWECDKRRRNLKKLITRIHDFDNDDELIELIRAFFPGREKEKDNLMEWISEFGRANENKLNLENLPEMLFITRPQHIRDSKDPYHDICKWIESIAGTSARELKRTYHRSSSSRPSQAHSARMEIIFEGFMPFAYYQMFVAWIIRFLNNLSRRPANRESPLVGKDKVCFDLKEQKLQQAMCEFHFSVAGCRDIVFRVTGPPPLSHQATSCLTHPGFSSKLSIKSHFEGKVGSVLKSKEHKTVILYNDGRRCVQVKISSNFVEWELLDLSLANDINASAWFMSLSYYLSFETIFDCMRKRCVKKAVFLSNMSPGIWRERYQLEAKECKQNPDENKNKSFVQLRPERDKFYSKNLEWEFDLLKSYYEGAELNCYRLRTEAN